MGASIANKTLELACTVGALNDAFEEIEDGADVNFDCGAPLFLAIINRNRDIIHLILHHGADGEAHLPQKSLKLVSRRNDLVEELIACRTIPTM